LQIALCKSLDDLLDNDLGFADLFAEIEIYELEKDTKLRTLKSPSTNLLPWEVKYVEGMHDDEVKSVLITTKTAKALNIGFDVTPPELVTGIITERGVVPANNIKKLYDERNQV